MYSKALWQLGIGTTRASTEWDACEAGESLMVQSNAPHSFFNKSERPCRVLSVSTYHHERMMKDAVHSEGKDRFSARSTHSGRFSEIDEVDGEESDISCRRPCLVSGHIGALFVFSRTRRDESSRQLTHRKVRTQDLLDFWVL